MAGLLRVGDAIALRPAATVEAVNQRVAKLAAESLSALLLVSRTPVAELAVGTAIAALGVVESTRLAPSRIMLLAAQ
jgi:hypothetical protein